MNKYLNYGVLILLSLMGQGCNLGSQFTSFEAPGAKQSSLSQAMQGIAGPWLQVTTGYELVLGFDGTFTSTTGIDTGEVGTYSISGNTLSFTGHGTVDAIGNFTYQCSFAQPTPFQLSLSCSRGGQSFSLDYSRPLSPDLFGTWVPSGGGTTGSLTFNSDARYQSVTGIDSGETGLYAASSDVIYFVGQGGVDTPGYRAYTCSYEISMEQLTTRCADSTSLWTVTYTKQGSASPSPCGVLLAGQSLGVGQSFSSCDGNYSLILQPDGNLVEYGPSGAVWSTLSGPISGNASGTGGTSFGASAVGNLAVMQADGNFVLYQNGSASWDSKTYGYAGSFLELQSDGNLVTYQMTSTGSQPTWSWASGNLVGRRCGTLLPGQGLSTGQSIRSCDGTYELILQTDGNLVVYGPLGALWSTSTGQMVAGAASTPSPSAKGNLAIMQADGNFVLYQGLTATWESTTYYNPGSELVLQTDGNLVVYQSTSGGGLRPLWSWMSGNLIGL